MLDDECTFGWWDAPALFEWFGGRLVFVLLVAFVMRELGVVARDVRETGPRTTLALFLLAVLLFSSFHWLLVGIAVYAAVVAGRLPRVREALAALWEGLRRNPELWPRKHAPRRPRAIPGVGDVFVAARRPHRAGTGDLPVAPTFGATPLPAPGAHADTGQGGQLKALLATEVRGRHGLPVQ
ncbi:MAG: hypothetical protein HYU66_10390 [Armatimonadetes bacterium]|nr:hypothetical protein [Armatimonadota bacterium]